MKTLDALPLQPLTSELYCPSATNEEEFVFNSVALLLGAASFGAGDNAA